MGNTELLMAADDLAILRALGRGEALFPHELEQIAEIDHERVGQALERLQSAGRVREAIPDCWMLHDGPELLIMSPANLQRYADLLDVPDGN